MGSLFAVLRLSPGQPPVIEGRGKVYGDRPAAVNAHAMATRAEPTVSFVLVTVTAVGWGQAPRVPVAAGDVDDRD